MTTNERAAPSPEVTARPETRTAAKLVRIDSQSSGENEARPGVDDPTAEVVEIKPYRETRGLRVRCPFCRKKHLHGHGWVPVEPVEPQVIHRVAHCGGGGYYIEIPAYAAELVRPGSKRRDGAR